MEKFAKVPSLLGQFFVLSAAMALVVLILLRLLKIFFRKVLHSNQKLHLRYLEKLFAGLIIFMAAFWVITTADATEKFGRMLFGGTAVIVALIGFAAQPVIADLICGIMLIVSRPFEIGDRIELSGGISGIVKDLTIRHVVLVGPDTMIYIIPNAQLSEQTITNMSRVSNSRSIFFRFYVSYDADVEKARQVIYQAIKDSPCSIPAHRISGGPKYGDVYFMAYKESSLELAVTVYYNADHRTEAVKNDINLRVRRALQENGIEIPYPYMNIIIKKEEEA